MKAKYQIPKQLLNIVLCVVLMLTSVPFTALAAETDPAVYDIYFELDTYTAGAPVNHGMSFTEMYPNVDPDKDLVPQKDFHTFIGWYESTDGGKTFKDTPYDFSSIVTGDVTLYPLFEIAVYDIDFELDTYTAGAPVNHGMSFTEMYPNVDPDKDLVPQKDFHTFIGWYESTDGGKTFKDTPYDFNSIVTGDVTLYPLFEIFTYTVTYKADGKVVATVEVEHGMDATAPEIPGKTGCTVAWDKDGKNITADTEINAVYTEIPATGDNTNLQIWFTLLFISGGAIFGITLIERKRRSYTTN